MKKIYVFLILVSCFHLNAQNSGKGFSYQAVARAGDGQIKASTNIEIQFSLLPGANAINPTWQEKHVTTTDEYGICNLTIGKGIKSGGTVAKYADIDYSSADYWLKVELKDNGVFQEIHKMQLLSVPYAEVSIKSDGVPIGSIIAFGADTNQIPIGWLLCNGKELNRTDFNILYTVVGNTWGAGNGTSTFNLPDMRGMFLRGVDGQAGNDPDKAMRISTNGGNSGNSVGSKQLDDFKKHTHKAPNSGDFVTFLRGGGPGYSSTAPGNPNGDINAAFSSKETISSGISEETRPKNVNVNYIIKIK